MLYRSTKIPKVPKVIQIRRTMLETSEFQGFFKMYYKPQQKEQHGMCIEADMKTDGTEWEIHK